FMCSSCFFFASRRRHTISKRDWSSDVCSSDLPQPPVGQAAAAQLRLIRQKQRLAVLDLTAAAEGGQNGEPLPPAVGEDVAPPAEIGRASCREGVQSAEDAPAVVDSVSRASRAR